MARRINRLQKNIGKVADFTSVNPPGLVSLLFLAEETGEVVKEFKRAIRDGKEIDDKAVQEEIGDVFTAICNLCNERNYNLKDIANEAVDKLSKRTGKTLDDDKDE